MMDRAAPAGQAKAADDRQRARTTARGVLLALALGAAIHAHCEEDATGADDAPATPNSEVPAAEGQAAAPGADSPHRAMSPLDRRVALLSKELNLDASQRVKVRKILEGQSQQVAQVWNDESVAAAARVKATQAIGDRTADQIRAVLNEEQRQRYIQPHRRDATTDASKKGVEAWMTPAKGK